MSESIHYIRGVIHYARLLGEPQLNKFTGEREWSVDITPNAEGRRLLRELGIEGRLRDPKPDDKAGRTESFLSFRQREYRADGKPAQPVKVVDSANRPWDDRLIGNESVGDVKFVVTPGKAGNKGMYIRGLRVLELVPYERDEFPALSPDDEYFANASSQEAVDAHFEEAFLGGNDEEEELNDDIPIA